MYDRKGNLIRKNIKTSAIDTTEFFIYQYDENGYLLKENHSLPEQGIENYFRYTYEDFK